MRKIAAVPSPPLYDVYYSESVKSLTEDKNWYHIFSLERLGAENTTSAPTLRKKGCIPSETITVNTFKICSCR
eukprot:UN09779